LYRPQYTFILCRGVEAECDELELVDLVCKRLDELLEEGYPLLGAVWVVEELDELVRQLVPQLALPVVLKGDEVFLELLRRLVPRIAQQIRDCVCVHRHGCGVVSGKE